MDSSLSGTLSEPVKIVVVGGGFSALAFLCTLIQQHKQDKASVQTYSVVVIDDTAGSGGLAWDEAYSSSVQLCNIHAHGLRVVQSTAEDMTMDGVDFPPFWQWFRDHDDDEDDPLRVPKEKRTENCYPPRGWFGRYVKARFSAARAYALNHGVIGVTLLHGRVGDISDKPEDTATSFAVKAYAPTHSSGHCPADSDWETISQDEPHRIVDADVVILACGAPHWISPPTQNACSPSQPSTQQEQLQNSDFISPWPARCLTKRIDTSRPVAILGTGLSAVDVAKHLHTVCEHPGPILMASRSGLLPAVHRALPAVQDTAASCDEVHSIVERCKQVLSAALDQKSEPLWESLQHALGAAWQEELAAGGIVIGPSNVTTDKHPVYGSERSCDHCTTAAEASAHDVVLRNAGADGVGILRQRVQQHMHSTTFVDHASGDTAIEPTVPRAMSAVVRRWQALVSAVEERMVVPLWRSMDNADKQSWRRGGQSIHHARSIFQTATNPMPLESATEILRMIDTGVLIVRGDLMEIHRATPTAEPSGSARPSENGISLRFGSPSTDASIASQALQSQHVDVPQCIVATGVGMHVDAPMHASDDGRCQAPRFSESMSAHDKKLDFPSGSNRFLAKLVSRGLVTAHPAGGLRGIASIRANGASAGISVDNSDANPFRVHRTSSTTRHMRTQKSSTATMTNCIGSMYMLGHLAHGEVYLTSGIGFCRGIVRRVLRDITHATVLPQPNTD
eukprot:m.715534 g.715534  ORF g.715534 m.715534 type:complete len:736 (-) comp22980_c0_seq6:51-2258(-)